MKYKCLVFDHDDTTVNSTATIHYPSFLEYIKIYHPEIHFSLEDYVRLNFDPGVLPFFHDICGLTDEEMVQEQDFWQEYASHHTADAFPGIKEIMEAQKAQGGLICVVSHSFKENILRDYAHNGLPVPDRIYGWDEPKEERKPSPHPLLDIMKRYDLTPDDILVIDDLKPGLEMARAAGTRFAAACWCFDIPENEAFLKKNADFFFQTVEELRRFLL